MDAHPAYPSPVTVRARQDVARIAFNAHTDNKRVRAALLHAIAVVERGDADSYCMAPGYDWPSIIAGLRDMLPQTESAEQVEALDEWARDRVGEFVA